jgi:TRAP-type C4-dicarboxylate transport system permease small subunit
MPEEKGFEKFVKRWSKRFNYVGYAACMLLLCLSVIDILTGKLFRWPLPGVFDIAGLIAVLIAAFPLASTELAGGHVRLDLGLVFLPKRIRRFCQLFANTLSLALVILLIYSSVKYGIKLLVTGEASMTVAIPFFPFVFAIVLGCLPLVLVFVLELTKPEAVEAEKEGDRL